MEPTVTDQTAAERWGDPPWRRQARAEGCWCADIRKPCTRHDGWDDGYETAVAAERGAIAELVSELWSQLGDYPQSLWAESLASGDSDAARLLAILETAGDEDGVAAIRNRGEAT